LPQATGVLGELLTAEQYIVRLSEICYDIKRMAERSPVRAQLGAMLTTNRAST